MRGEVAAGLQRVINYREDAWFTDDGTAAAGSSTRHELPSEIKYLEIGVHHSAQSVHLEDGGRFCKSIYILRFVLVL